VEHLHDEWRRTAGMHGLGGPLPSWPVCTPASIIAASGVVNTSTSGLYRWWCTVGSRSNQILYNGSFLTSVSYTRESPLGYMRSMWFSI